SPRDPRERVGGRSLDGARARDPGVTGRADAAPRVARYRRAPAVGAGDGAGDQENHGSTAAPDRDSQGRAHARAGGEGAGVAGNARADWAQAPRRPRRDRVRVGRRTAANLRAADGARLTTEGADVKKLTDYSSCAG